MQKLASLLAAAIIFLGLPAAAQICGPVPFTIQNGTVTDADEVMANYNAIVDCVNLSAATNGANSDITSLSGLTTPLSLAQGGTPVHFGAVSSTVTNAYTTTSVSPSNFTFAASKIMAWVAPAANTGTATMNPNSLGAATIYRQLGSGAVELAAGQIVSGGNYLTTYNGTRQVILNPTPIAPTVTVLTSGSGTYTTPTGALYLEVEMVGGGSGGGGGNNGTLSTAGGSTTFGSLTAGGAAGSSNVATGAGGSAAGGDVNIVGGTGQGGAASLTGSHNAAGGAGAASPLGGAGGTVYPTASPSGNNAAANSGAGGGGGHVDNGTTAVSGSGGSAGGYVRKMISGPSATYGYAVGAGGVGAAGGANGSLGGAGAAGIIIVRAHFQ